MIVTCFTAGLFTDDWCGRNIEQFFMILLHWMANCSFPSSLIWSICSIISCYPDYPIMATCFCWSDCIYVVLFSLFWATWPAFLFSWAFFLLWKTRKCHVALLISSLFPTKRKFILVYLQKAASFLITFLR